MIELGQVVAALDAMDTIQARERAEAEPLLLVQASVGIVED